MKYTFKAEHKSLHIDQIESTITVESNSDCLDDILQDFDNFLRGCGYIPKGLLQYVDEEDV